MVGASEGMGHRANDHRASQLSGSDDGIYRGARDLHGIDSDLGWPDPIYAMVWSIVRDSCERQEAYFGRNLSYGFIVRLPLSHTLLSIAVPTVYLWVVDTLALKRGTWVIESGTKFGVHFWPGLDIEWVFSPFRLDGSC